MNFEALALELAIAAALAKGVIDAGAFGEALAQAASRLRIAPGILAPFGDDLGNCAISTPAQPGVRFVGDPAAVTPDVTPIKRLA